MTAYLEEGRWKADKEAEYRMGFSERMQIYKLANTKRDARKHLYYIIFVMLITRMS